MITAARDWVRLGCRWLLVGWLEPAKRGPIPAALPARAYDPPAAQARIIAPLDRPRGVRPAGFAVLAGLLAITPGALGRSPDSLAGVVSRVGQAPDGTGAARPVLGMRSYANAAFDAAFDSSGALRAPLMTDGSGVGSQGPVVRYRAVPGDTLWEISQQRGVSVMTLWWANRFADAQTLGVGQLVRVLPTSGIEHVVRDGDTIDSIARDYGADAGVIADQNRLTDGIVVLGQRLIIPDGSGDAYRPLPDVGRSTTIPRLRPGQADRAADARAGIVAGMLPPVPDVVPPAAPPPSEEIPSIPPSGVPGTPPVQPPDTTPEQPPDTTPEQPPDTTPEQPPDTTPEQPPDTTPEQPPDTTPEQPPSETSPEALGIKRTAGVASSTDLPGIGSEPARPRSTPTVTSPDLPFGWTRSTPWWGKLYSRVVPYLYEPTGGQDGPGAAPDAPPDGPQAPAPAPDGHGGVVITIPADAPVPHGSGVHRTFPDGPPPLGPSRGRALGVDDPRLTLTMAQAMRDGLLWPVYRAGTISQLFHAAHPAIDISAAKGTPLLAPYAGIVVFRHYRDDRCANAVWIKHGPRFFTSFCHMWRFSDVQRGDWVEQGEVIGYLGNGGYSTGPHLHFGVSVASPADSYAYRRDPLLFLRRR